MKKIIISVTTVVLVATGLSAAYSVTKKHNQEKHLTITNKTIKIINQCTQLTVRLNFIIKV